MKLNLNLAGSLYSRGINNIFAAKSQQNQQNVRFNNQYYCSDNVCFSGITKQMSGHTYIDGQKDIKKIVKEHENRNLILGQIPDFIQAKFPPDRHEECIKEFYDVFGQIVTELRDFDETKVFSIDEIKKRRKNSTKDLYVNLLQKYNLVSPWDDVDIEYLDKGGKGAGYKLTGLRNPNFDEDEYVLKVYHLIEGRNWQPYKSHGNYAENNSAAYWMKNVGYDTQRGKYLFGDLKTGYMVIKYVDDDVRLPKRNINPYEYGLKCTDENADKKHNVCKNYSFDWGGVRVINRIKNESKTARKIYNTIKYTDDKYKIQEWYRLLASKKYDNSQKNAGLAMAIKHLPGDKTDYIDECIRLNDPYVDRALAYVLKYLSFNDAIKYFEKLVKTDDDITQVILFNEIPLLCMKHRDDNIKDDLQTVRSEILPHRVKAYYDIAEKYALPGSIEHLASFLHLLPKEQFRTYYKRLVTIDNNALHDRLIYKLPNVEPENRFFAMYQIAQNVKDDKLKKELLINASLLPEGKLEKIENLTGLKYKDVKKEIETS